MCVFSSRFFFLDGPVLVFDKKLKVKIYQHTAIVSQPFVTRRLFDAATRSKRYLSTPILVIELERAGECKGDENEQIRGQCGMKRRVGITKADGNAPANASRSPSTIGNRPK